MISNKSNMDMIFMQYKITTCRSIDEVLKKNKENPYLKWRTQREEEQNSEVLQIPNFLDHHEALDDQHTSYKGPRWGKHSS